MSMRNQMATELLIRNGADIEALDSYGYTPLHRMASNNLAVGAKVMLDAGADPLNRGGTGATPLEIAQASKALEVVKVLEAHGTVRRSIPIMKIVVQGAG